MNQFYEFVSFFHGSVVMARFLNAKIQFIRVHIQIIRVSSFILFSVHG